MADKKTSNAEEPKKKAVKADKASAKSAKSDKKANSKSPQRRIHSNPWPSSSKVLIPSVKR